MSGLKRENPPTGKTAGSKKRITGKSDHKINKALFVENQEDLRGNGAYDAETVTNFLKLHSPNGEWCVTAIVPDKGTKTQTFNDMDKAEQFIRQRNAAGENVYYSVNRPKGAMDKKAAKADIAQIEYLHVDADPNDDETPEEFKARFLPQIAAYDKKPTFVIDSGNGVQLLFKLSESVKLNGTVSWADIEARNYALAKTFGASPSTRNVDRILRIPGTVNYPNAKKRRCGRTACATRTIEYNDATYPLDAFAPWAGVIDEFEQKSNRKRQTIKLPTDLPTVDIDAEFGFLSVEFRQLIRNGPPPGNDRSKDVWRVACVLARAKTSPEVIASILLDQGYKISDHNYDHPGDPRKYVKRQVERVLEAVAKEDERTIVLDFTNGRGRPLTTTQWMIEQGALTVNENGEIVERWDDDSAQGAPANPPSKDKQESPPKGKQQTQSHIFDPWAEYVVPAFPLDIFPDRIRRYVENSGILMGCDTNAFAMCLLGAFSGAISHQFEIRPLHSGDWTERPILWVAMIGDPGTKKTPMVNAAVSPLKAIESAMRREHDQKYAEWKQRDKCRKSKDKDDEIWDDEPEPPPRLLGGDATYERLVRIMARSTNNGLLACHDELAGLIGGFGRYNNGGGKERGFYLTAWNGGMYIYDRVSGGEGNKGVEMFIANCSVAIIGGIQMERLRDFTDIIDDGLLQRFLPVIISRCECPKEIGCDSGSADYGDLIKRCVEAKPVKVLLTDEARATFDELRRYLHELGRAAKGVTKGFSEFLSKLDGYSLRIALVLHVIENPERSERLLDDKNAQNAARLIKEFIIPHALECYRTLESVTRGDRLKALASYLLTARDRDGKPKNRFVPSDFTSNIAIARNMSVKEVEDLISPFVACDWLDELDDTARPVRGRKAQTKWELNPKVRVEYAERQASEEARKAMLAELMNAPARRREADEGEAA